MKKISLKMDLVKVGYVDVDVETWLSPIKYTCNEACLRMGLDIVNDERNRTFWEIGTDKNSCVVIDEKMLNYFGYSGHSYHNKKVHIARLLRKNSHIKFEEVASEDDPRKRYYKLNSRDFETLLMQMRTRKATELRYLYADVKFILTKFCEYEKLYERHQSQMLRRQNNELMESMKDLKSVMLTVKSDADRERQLAEEREQKAEEERIKAEERERKAEEERMKAEDERMKAEIERKVAEERGKRLENQLRYSIDVLRSEIAPHMAPEPINKKKIRNLGK